MKIYFAAALLLCLSACEKGGRQELHAVDVARSAAEAQEAADPQAPIEGMRVGVKTPPGISEVGPSSDAAYVAANTAAEAADAASNAADASAAPHRFEGYDCTQDCSGHEAGYAWAQENAINDPADCGGKSQSFIEGCEAYAEGRQSADSADADADEVSY